MRPSLPAAAEVGDGNGGGVDGADTWGEAAATLSRNFGGGAVSDWRDSSTWVGTSTISFCSAGCPGDGAGVGVDVAVCSGVGGGAVCAVGVGVRSGPGVGVCSASGVDVDLGSDTGVGLCRAARVGLAAGVGVGPIT